jgi:hypothetical protein
MNRKGISHLLKQENFDISTPMDSELNLGLFLLVEVKNECDVTLWLANR